jgi:hypothetical protein
MEDSAMSTKSYFSPAVLATNLAKAFEKGGATPEEIDKIHRDEELIRGYLGVFRRTHEIKLITPEISVERIRIINETTIMVNLDAPPTLPFADANIKFQTGTGWVRIEKCPDGLYVDDRKVIFYLSKRQKEGKDLKGYELREELFGKSVLHPNILDALYEHQNIIPEDWRMDKDGNIHIIFFWGVIFCAVDGSFSVRSFFFLSNRWYRHERWLGDGWSFSSSAALLAS